MYGLASLSIQYLSAEEKKILCALERMPKEKENMQNSVKIQQQ